MPKIRVLHISLTRDLGGIAAYQKNLLDNIDKHKYSLDYLSPHKDAMLIPYLEQMGCRVHIVPSEKKFIPYFLGLYKVMKNGHYDAVHIHKNSLVNSLPFFAAKLAGIKTIVAHSHNTLPSNGTALRFMHYFCRPIVRKMCTVRLACSVAASDWLFGKKYPAEVIKNSIDLARFSYNETVRKQVRDELGVGDELLIGHVGNYFHQKNHRFMVQIMAEMKKIDPKAKLVLVGKGELLEETQHYAKELKVDDRILFLGARSDADRLYQAMDVFLLPSFSEGFPFVGLEAQAAGLPFLMSDKVPDEIILTDECYSMSLSQSPCDWAKKICGIAKNSPRKDNYELLAKKGYDVKESAKSLEKYYAMASGERQ